MSLPIPLRRLAYRLAHRVLRVYWGIRRPALTGVKCVLIDGDSVLLVRHTYGRRMWDLPGGKAARGEPPHLTAQREMREELGLAIAAWTAIGELHVRDHNRRDTLFCYQVRVHAPVLKLDLGELQGAAWFRYDRLPDERGPFVDPILARTDLSNGRPDGAG